MKLNLSILLLLLFMSCDSNNEQEIKQETEGLKLKIDSIIENNKFNGVVLVTQDTSLIYERTIGYSDLENKISIRKNDQFVIGSISKQITAVLILREYENGKIELNDKISEYLPELNQPWAKDVNIHHLLTHMHGIVDLNEPLVFEQGTIFRYSQLGYELLAQILEETTQKSFNELSMKLFNEFGLFNTFHPDHKASKNLVKGYEVTADATLEYVSNSLGNYAAAGSFISTAVDLSKWNQLLYAEKIVNKTSLDLMRTRYATRVHPIFGEVEYGYGLLFENGAANIEIGALGYAPGFVSACYYYPKKNMNLVVLENTARNLNDFRSTFKVHIELMKLMKIN